MLSRSTRWFKKWVRFPKRSLKDLLKNDVTAHATFKENLQYSYAHTHTHTHTHKHTQTHAHTVSFVGNMAGMWDREQSMWKGRGGSSLPERCYSGPHASASVSANERNSALFHLVSLDQELASPKTDAARGTEGGRERKREGEPQRNAEREREKWGEK